MRYYKLKKNLIYWTVFALIPFASFGQIPFNKEYCAHTSVVTGFCLTLKNDSAFSYHSWWYQGGGSGDGIYKLLGNKLTLLFKNTDTIYRSYARINDAACNSNDSVLLKVLVISNETNNPIGNIQININSYDVITSAITNEKGEAVLKLKKSEKLVFFDAKDYAQSIFKSYSAKINLEKCKDFKINLKKSPHSNYSYDICSFPDGEVKNYEIEVIENEKIILSEEDSLYVLKKK